MGLIKAASTSIRNILADQWIDYFYCDSIDENVLAVKASKRMSNGSSNKKGSDNYITSGSIITVADGQCMMIVEQGKIIDVCSEPGEYIFDSERSQGIFTDDSIDAIGRLFEKTADRFTYGGQTALDQRVYYFNTKEITGNRFGTPSPIPFRVIDSNVGIDMDVSLKCFGTFSYRISVPYLFYKNVTGNIIEPYMRDRIDEQLESEVISVLQPAFARLSLKGVRYSALPVQTEMICEEINDLLSKKWLDLRGLEVVSFSIKGLRAKEEDEKMLKELQMNATFRDPSMAAAHLVGAKAEAMKAAASNETAGAAAAFIGMNMASNSAGINVEDLFAMGEKKSQSKQESTVTSDKDGWTCSCGSNNTGQFCPVCGNKKPESNKNQFCENCGYKLSLSENNAKFCPNCGKPLK